MNETATRISVRLDERTRNRLDVYRHNHGLDIANAIRSLLNKGLDSEEVQLE